MSNIFFTSDTHFGHKNILKFSPNTRKEFTDIIEHDNHLVDVWNSQVNEDSTIYIIGDMFMCGTKRSMDILTRLRGNKILVLGNHDRHLRKIKSELLESKIFSAIEDYLTIRIDGHMIVMFHFPISEWENMHYGSFHLHGHTHGSLQQNGRSLDVGIDNRPNGDMKLWTWDEVKEFMLGREPNERSLKGS